MKTYALFPRFGFALLLLFAGGSGVSAAQFSSPDNPDVPAPAATNCVTAPSGLVSWWRGEGNALDSAGTNNGTLVGNVTFAPGMVGQGFLLNGTNSYIRIPHSASLNFDSALTIE